MLQNANLSPEDFGGEQYDGCNEYLNVTRPDVLDRIHREYLDAGADIISTNTFGGTPIVLDDYDLGEQAHDINFRAAKIAKNVRKTFPLQNGLGSSQVQWDRQQKHYP